MLRRTTLGWLLLSLMSPLISEGNWDQGGKKRSLADDMRMLHGVWRTETKAQTPLELRISVAEKDGSLAASAFYLPGAYHVPVFELKEGANGRVMVHGNGSKTLGLTTVPYQLDEKSLTLTISEGSLKGVHTLIRVGDRPVNGIAASAVLVERRIRGISAFEIHFTLKNVSGKPITVCEYLGHMPLQVRWTGPDGKALKSRHYDFLERIDLLPQSKDNFYVLAPGGEWRIDHSILFYAAGKPIQAFAGTHVTHAGEHRVTVSYQNKDDGKKFGLPNVWTGAIEANEVRFTVGKPKAAAPDNCLDENAEDHGPGEKAAGNKEKKKPAVLTPDTMAGHEFSVAFQFQDSKKPAGETGLIDVHLSFDANKGPAIQRIVSAGLRVQDGDRTLLNVPVPLYLGASLKYHRHTRMMITKDMLQKAQLALTPMGFDPPPSHVIDLGAFYRAAVGAAKTEKADKPKADAGAIKDPHDRLWLLRMGETESNQRAFRSLTQTLEKGKVPSADKAEREALGHKLKSGGLMAEELAKVTGLLRLGVDVPDFADQGDLVWVVRITHLERGVTQELWVSAKTGAIRTILPIKPQPR